MIKRFKSICPLLRAFGKSIFQRHNINMDFIFRSLSLVSASSQTRKEQKANEDPSNKKTYPKKATGAALSTVKKHTKEDELKFYASSFW